MDLYFAGCEQPIYLRQLADLGVKHVAISFYEWQRRHSSDDLYRHVPSDISVCITAGVAKKDDVNFKEFAEDYVEFCERNAEHALVYDMDAAHCPTPIRKSVRDRLAMLPNTVMFAQEGETLTELAHEFERVGINASTAKSIPPNELRRLQATLYGSNITDPKVLRINKFAATTSFAWMSGKRYGELWVFSRNKLHHYSADKLHRAVKAHWADIEGLGVDAGLCAANDHDALTAVAVKSLQVMASSFTKRPRDRQDGEAAAISPNEGGDKVVAVEPPHPAGLVLGGGIERERSLLPGVVLDSQLAGALVTSTSEMLRQCNSCNLSDVCAKYEANAACAYMFPVEIKTKDQWQSASQTLLELQYQRIMFASMAEQAEGGILTPRLGQEMDRFHKMLKDVKELESTPDTSKGGALSRIFGAAPDGDLTPELENNGNEADEEAYEASHSYEDPSGFDDSGEAEFVDAEFADVEEDATA